MLPRMGVSNVRYNETLHNIQAILNDALPSGTFINITFGNNPE